MRETERRKRLTRAKAAGQAEASAAIAEALNQHKKLLMRELRRGNLHKRLHKAQAEHGDLEKAFGLDWRAWVTQLTQKIKSALFPVADKVSNVEKEYWLNRGKHLDPLDAEQVIAAYEQRTGRQIGDIAEDIRSKVLHDITEWYNSEETFADLVDRLSVYFTPERADMIARTETAFISSQVSDNAMEQFGIELWNFDLTPHPGSALYPCQQCTDYAALNPHKRGDPMPPLHPNCDDGIVYIVEEDGNEGR